MATENMEKLYDEKADGYEKFNLSKKREDFDGYSYSEKDVKEFIRLLKEDILNTFDNLDENFIQKTNVINKLDKLAGDKLI